MHLSIDVLVLGVYTCTSIRCVFIALICRVEGERGRRANVIILKLFVMLY